MKSKPSGPYKPAENSPNPGEGESGATVIHARLAILGSGSGIVENATLVAKDGVIRALGPAGQVPAPAEPAQVYHYREGFLLPGLIDTHVHLILPGDGQPADELVQSRTDEELRVIAEHNGQTALAAGITTVRDVGSRGRILFNLRDAIAGGFVQGPRLLASGPPITITGGHCHYMGAQANGTKDVRRTARTILQAGADLIKVMGSGGATPGTSFWQPNYDAAEIRAAAEEAHRKAARITVHASCVEAIEAALAAEVDMLEHASMWTAASCGPVCRFQPQLAEALAEAGAYVARTLQATYSRLHELQQQAESASLTETERALLETRRRIFEHAMESFGRLRAAGVLLVAGTDAGWDINPFGNHYVTGLELAAETGMPTWEVIEHATSRAAEAIGLRGKVGVLEPGQAADLLVVDANPLEEIGALRRPVAVFQNGRLVARDRGA
jgi:imidazolonepropionase-like amidohydrolase